jgi:hypothetical protein
LTIRTRSLVVAGSQWPVASEPEDPLTTDHRPLTTSSDQKRTACAWSETTVCRIFSCQRPPTRSSAPASKLFSAVSPC